MVLLQIGDHLMIMKVKRSSAAELPSKPDNTIYAVLEQAQQLPAASSGKPLSKSAQVIALLEREDGVTLTDLCAATGWQPHSCRAFFTGLRKRGLVLERSHRSDGASTYRLVAAEGAAQ